MHKCKACQDKLPHLKSHRTRLEKYVTHRNKDKYKCETCGEINFISIR